MKLFKTSLLILLCFSSIYPKNIIFDLGDVLIGVNRIGIAREIGISNFISYLFIDWKSPSLIQAKAFALLREIKNETHQELYDIQQLPELFQELMQGKLSSQQIIQSAFDKIEELAQSDAGKTNDDRYFCSSREQELLKKTILAMFTPTILAKHSYPLLNILKIVKECAQKTDQDGNKQHQLFILSNFAGDVFDELYTQQHMQPVFEVFTNENICISGKLGLAKPDPEVFTYVLGKYELKAEESVFIDDRAENIAAAEELGITGIHLATPDSQYLRAVLEKLNIL